MKGRAPDKEEEQRKERGARRKERRGCSALPQKVSKPPEEMALSGGRA